MPEADPRRPWYSVDVPAILVICVFLLVVEAILAITYYRRQVALIPEPGRAAPRHPGETHPPTRETPETLP